MPIVPQEGMIGMASFKKLATGWQFRISYKDGETYRTKSGNGYPTKKDAQIAAADIEQKLQKGLDIKAGDTLFLDYYSKWVDTYKTGKFSFESDRNYQTAINLVKKQFPGLRLKDISKQVYQAFINEYAQTHSKATVRKIHNKIAPCLREAFRSGDIAKDVAYKIQITGTDGKKEIDKYLSEAETIKLLDALMQDIHIDYSSRYMCILQLATGARIGEIMALTYDSLDFKKNTLTINKSWDYKSTHGFKPTKNKENRTIGVDAKTMALLKPYYDEVKKASLKSRFNNPHRLVFVSINGDPITVDAVNKCLRHACIRAGIPTITSHGLRHTHASILLLHHLDLHYVSERLGHKSQITTASIYAHVLKETKERGDERAAEIAGSLYADAK